MGRYARIRAAKQMDRDGIRSLNRRNVGRCAHKGPESFGFVTGCKNSARYHIEGVGDRCFTHAAPFIGRALAQEAASNDAEGL
jgi:hypothetical protein